MENGFYLGEIISGEQWETDDAPVVVKPVFFSVSITPRHAEAKQSVFIKVVVNDVPVSTE